jgi:hypothetical protein
MILCDRQRMDRAHRAIRASPRMGDGPAVRIGSINAGILFISAMTKR